MDARSPEARREAHLEGLQAEELVAARLASVGWSVVARNWLGGGGELDVVVSQGGRLRFVEVKARRPGQDDGLDAVGPTKRARLVRAAEAFLQAWTEPVTEACFLVAVVHLPAPGSPEPARVEWIDDAFDAG